MPEQFSYRDYVSNDTFTESYVRYQDRYLHQARESDKVIIKLIGEILGKSASGNNKMILLDVGCSTGNLLVHLRREFPALDLVGADMAQPVLDKCRATPELAGVRFEIMNVLDLSCERRFDIITINAVLYMLTDEEFEQALMSASKALRENGKLLIFDFFHTFEQDLAIFEKSKSHPNGLMLHFRPYSMVKTALEKAGFSDTAFHPFNIPIDLNRNATYSTNQDGFEDLNSYTRLLAEGERLLFRGTLFQPWCHLVAQKRA